MGFGVFETAVTALRAHNAWLSVIGDNLANMNTAGFKRSDLRFATLLGSNDNDNCGKPLPSQVKTFPVRVFTQGPLNLTSRPLDLALQGDGFFAVKVGTEEMYTRDGGFDFDKEGVLRHIASGGEVLDSKGNSIRAPIDMVIPAEATTRVDIAGNFEASAPVPLQEVLASQTPFSTKNGAIATAATALNDIASNTVPYQDGDTITISGRDRDGSTRSAVFVYGQGRNGTTLGDLAGFVDGVFSGASAAIQNGALVLTADTPGAADLQLTLEDGLTKADGTPQAGSTDFAAHTMEEIVAGTDPASFSSSVEVFDAKGKARQLNLTFTKTGHNLWNMTADMAGATFADNQVTGIRFNENGSFSGVTGTGAGDSNITFQLPDSSPVTINLNFGQPGSFSGATQFGGYTDAGAQRQNGSPAGFFERVDFDAQGNVIVAFSNGKTRNIGQLKVVNFPNPEGLSAASSNLFRKGPESGDPVQGPLQSGSTTVVQHYLEGSNVDQAQELTNMIMAQNGYAANARSITVAQRLFDIATSLVG